MWKYNYSYQNELYGYIVYTNPEINKRLYYVSDVRCTKAITIISVYVKT